MRTNVKKLIESIESPSKIYEFESNPNEFKNIDEVHNIARKELDEMSDKVKYKVESLVEIGKLPKSSYVTNYPEISLTYPLELIRVHVIRPSLNSEFIGFYALGYCIQNESKNGDYTLRYFGRTDLEELSNLFNKDEKILEDMTRGIRRK